MNSAMMGQVRPPLQAPSFHGGTAAMPLPANRRFHMQAPSSIRAHQAAAAAAVAVEEARLFRIAKMEAEFAQSMAVARFKAAAASNAARMSLLRASSYAVAAAPLHPQHAPMVPHHRLSGAVIPSSPAVGPLIAPGSSASGKVSSSPGLRSSGLDLLSDLAAANESKAPEGSSSPDSKGAAACLTTSDTESRASPSSSDSLDSNKEGKTFIETIREWDVLCGRGGKSNHHPGNKRYRQVVGEMKMMYRNTEAKSVKTDVSRCVVEHVLAYGGRFVKKDEKSGRYYILTRGEARKKTSQALRETKVLKWTL